MRTEMGSGDFIDLVGRLVDLRGRQLFYKNESILSGLRYDFVLLTFINLPESGHGGGAEAENNKMGFSVDGFGKDTPHSPPPSGKVKLEHRTSAFPREYNLRGKTASPEVVAKYLASYLNDFISKVEPRFTHRGF